MICPKCGRKTNQAVKCIICQIDDKHPGNADFAQEIRDKVKVFTKKRKHRSLRGTSAYTNNYQGRS